MSPDEASAAGAHTVALQTSVATALADARALGLDRLDAQLLLGHLLKQPRSWLIAHDDAPLPTATALAFSAGCQRRAAGEPLAYLLGEREFHGLMLQVTPDVLVPRPDTETLVDWALDLLPAGTPAQVLDLGTGSGAVALALAQRRPLAQIMATDLSRAALTVAQANAARLGLHLTWACGHWWQALATQARFDLVLANPPYIAGDDPHLPALRHEPLMALTPGGDGLGALIEIIAGAVPHLVNSGWLLLEHGWDQAAAVRSAMQSVGLDRIRTRHDIEGRERCTGGCWPGPG